MMMMHPSHSRRGFTLVEMMVVLIIIAFLIGSIVIGRSLISASRLQSISSDISIYNSAVSTFKTKYLALPGDMKTATSLWGTATGCPNTAHTSIATCNGNGNEIINLTTNAESFNAWQHLANEGLIAGKFSGVPGSGGAAHHVIGTNAPGSNYKSAGFSLTSFGDLGAGVQNEFTAGSAALIQKIIHVFIVGAETATGPTYGPILYPADAQNIETKSDDGKPDSGNIMAFGAASTTNPGCTSGSPAAYVVQSSSQLCALFFIGQF